MQGHPSTHTSLGATAVLREGIIFSNEPGLFYNPRDGYGHNQSNTVVVAANGAHRMNRTSLTREFRWITNRRSGGGFGTRGRAGRNRSTVFCSLYPGVPAGLSWCRSRCCRRIVAIRWRARVELRLRRPRVSTTLDRST